MKTKLLLAVLVLGLFATGCKKEYITQETVNQTTLGTTVLKTYSAADWILNSTTNTYYLPITLAGDDFKYLDGDGLLVYVAYTDTDPWQAIPQVVDGFSLFYYYLPASTSAPALLTLETQMYDGVKSSVPNTIHLKIVTVPSNIVK